MSAKLIVTTGLALILMNGCSTSLVESPTWMNENRVEVGSDVFTDTFETRRLDSGMVKAIATTYSRYGNGDMTVVTSYDPRSSTNTAGAADTALANLKAGLTREGVQTIHAATSAAVGTGDVSTTVISFPALTARPPEGCTMMPGYEKVTGEIQSDDAADPKYRFGCSIETLMARQVARPSDLMGRPGFETKEDGARAERVITTRGYYGDQPNADLNGEKASGD